MSSGFTQRSPRPSAGTLARGTGAAFGRALGRALGRAIRPETVVVVTGSAGKTTATRLLAHLLGDPPEIGCCSFGNEPGDVIRQFRRQSLRARAVVAEATEYPRGSLDTVAAALRPNVAVLTIAGLDHYTGFRDREAVAEEVSRLAKALPAEGVAIVNGDDAAIMAATGDIAARRVVFGTAAGRDYRLIDATCRPTGRLTLVVTHAGVERRLATRLVGAHMSVPVLAAIAAAHVLGRDFDAIAARLATFEPVHGRCSIVETPGGPTFVCDTYKAPAWSLNASFDVIAAMEAARRRTIVLGTISDYAGASRPIYRRAWRAALDRADRVIGLRHGRSRLSIFDADFAAGRAMIFDTAREIADHLRATAVPGEVVLLKGSVSADHLDRIALSFVEPVHCWLDRCGRDMNCRFCELMADPAPERWRALKDFGLWASGHRRING